MAPRAAPESPKSARERPRSRQEPPKPALANGWAAKGRPEAFWASGASFKRVFESFLGAPGTSFSSFFFRCCPRTLRLLPLCPSNAGSAGARASAYNPPTTACGATSVFETPSVLRESLPSYSAKPGAFYAPRALRWTTPPRGRTDPFQGPKIKPMFHRFSMLFKKILRSKMEGQIDAQSSLRTFQDALGAGSPGDTVC